MRTQGQRGNFTRIAPWGLYNQFPVEVLFIERLTPYGGLATVCLPPLSLRR